MTIGELARLFNDAFGIGASLDVVPLEGWRRPMYHDETGVPWVIPSPNLPTLDSAIVYPGAVLFEGTRLSEGPRHDSSVRTDWRTLDRRRTARRCDECPRTAWCAFPARILRADIPEARKTDLWRVPAARRRSTRVSPGAHGGGIDGGVPPPGPGAFRLARASLRIRARQAADRHSVRLATASHALDGGSDLGALLASWAPEEEAFRRTREPYLIY